MEVFRDLLGEMCPVPVLVAREDLGRIGEGDRIVIETDHSCAVASIRAVVRKLRVKMKVEEVTSGIWRITLWK